MKKLKQLLVGNGGVNNENNEKEMMKISYKVYFDEPKYLNFYFFFNAHKI
jgi:hypothetical protein